MAVFNTHAYSYQNNLTICLVIWNDEKISDWLFHCCRENIEDVNFLYMHHRPFSVSVHFVAEQQQLQYCTSVFGETHTSWFKIAHEDYVFKGFLFLLINSRGKDFLKKNLWVCVHELEKEREECMNVYTCMRERERGEERNTCIFNID